MVTRREFLRSASWAGAAIALPGCNSDSDSVFAPGPATSATFRHGVASGDPLTDRVILWTRLTTEALGTIPVDWRVATDPALQNIIASGSTSTGPARDYTVKVDAILGERPGQTFYYQFQAGDTRSPIGRTKLAPASGVEHLRIAVVSCASYPHGYFNAYRTLAKRRDLDLVLHLGDYIYEYGNGEGQYGADVQAGGRKYAPEHEILTLEDYRVRHAHYRLDPDLQLLHQQNPFVTVWDDHETTNDSYRDGAENHNEGEGDWQTRKGWGQQAYFEWLPIREVVPGDNNRIFRTLPLGDLADLILLDTRLHGRELQPQGIGGVVIPGLPVSPVALDSADRQLLGAEQEAWFLERLRGAGERWKLIGQQVMFAQLKLPGTPNLPAVGGGVYLNGDQWDGYNVARQRIFDALKGAGGGNAINDFVVLTGDIHTSWASELSDDPNNPLTYNPLTGSGSLGVEFVAPSITSPGLPQLAPVQDAISLINPHIKYTDLEQHGYVLLDINPDRIQAEWWFVDDILAPSETEIFGRAFQVQKGSNHLAAAAEPAAPRSGAPEFAPV